ncbi:hypothetical protein [Borrelia miyamotoi]|uniref:Uncharacterized protein n=1 Tax=Borrelia miyamotoi TaxID=47466 RepID=A0AAQ2WWI1_9SPIR|nr:hypothetical protein [Borrelia miyamotoi]AOW96396.1 hypothetical protein AXH25_04490 [Borrelia miyamotoi]QTL84114.1 hypothetical protein bmLB2001_001192 [Borrelia miyamotoi]WAZ85722.1 hypothetical protein O5400_05070 [Borrelia miyamotoi]WAZ91504.1 hypothetical protein O5398_05060 [Borrelia miyamotoi]WAZ92792.1 hypothetical protein O5402_05070 [Borrelia miyamotoi]
MTFKNRESKYNILFGSNLSIANIAKIMDVSESTVLKARLSILGEFASNKNKTDTTFVSSSDSDLDSLAISATIEAYKLEGERDRFYKEFYRIANSYINSHFKYKEFTFQSAFKKLINLNEKISSLEKEISGSNDVNLCRRLRLKLQHKIYKRNLMSKNLILNDMKEDYECLIKLKEIFKSKGLKLG